MNDRDLTRLLDDAANAFEPTPSPGRLALALAPPRSSGRRLYTVIGIAAGLTALGAGAAAMTGAESAIRTPGDGFEVDVTIERGEVVATPTTADDDQKRQRRDRKRPDRPVAAIVNETDDDDHATGGDGFETLRLELAPLEVVEVGEPEIVVEPEPEPAPAAAPKPEPKPEPKHEDPPPPATTQPPHPEPPTTTTTEPAHQPPPPTTTEAPHEDPPPVGFSAHQQWGSCASDPPYDEWSGTATPGTVISISSPYGSGSTEADGEGHWYIKVFFNTAPVGVPFDVALTTSGGDSASFSFVRTG